MRILFIVSVLSFLAACAARNHPDTALQHCVPIDETQIAAQFDRWNQTLRSLDPDQVVGRYAPGSMLLPTLSSTPRISADEKRDYFDDFLAGRPSGQITQRVIVLGCNQAIDSGLYDFSFADGATAQARYTFSYIWDGQDWLISSHHSSLLPPEP